MDCCSSATDVLMLVCVEGGERMVEMLTGLAAYCGTSMKKCIFSTVKLLLHR